MTDTTEYSKDLILGEKVYKRGFTPELIAVTPGSYASVNHLNVTPGVPSVVLNSYLVSGAELLRGSIAGSGNPLLTSVTGCDIRQDDTNVEFVCCVTLYGAYPGFVAGNEVRIRPMPPIITQPPRWGVPLPLPQDSPTFDIEIIDALSGVEYSVAANTILKARLLVNGQIALFVKNTAAPGTEVALTNAFFSTIMDIGEGKNIIIRGKYLCFSPNN